MAPISGNLAWAWLTQPLCAGGKSACDADNTAAQGTYFLIAVNSGLVAILYYNNEDQFLFIQKILHRKILWNGLLSFIFSFLTKQMTG
jgi:hypothetical protein